MAILSLIVYSLLCVAPVLPFKSDYIGTKIRQLEENASEQSKKVSALVDIIDALKIRINGIEGENAKLRSENKVMHWNLARLDSHEITRRLLEGAETRDQYAFYAYMSRDEPDPGGHHILVYDTLVTNIGHSYNNFTGIFTVPKDGIYSFTWSTRVACHLAHTTDLTLNGNVLGSTYAYCGYNTVTGHVVTQASQGDAVFVRTHSKTPGQGAIKSDEFGRSAFSGFLI